MTKHTVYLGLGSNLGNRQRNLRRAIAQIKKLIGDVERQSTFIVTKPWGYESANDYLNACIRVLTELTPRQLLQTTQAIERDMGRTSHSATDDETGIRLYSDRPIDIDILLYDNLTIDEPDLQIPHPRMYGRDFVMTPLREIADPQSSFLVNPNSPAFS